MTGPQRLLLVTADDFGIGPGTSRGILDLGAAGVVTSTVMLVNSPHAADGVAQWHAAGRPVELGWHPCLTLDRPILPAAQVPSLVDADGRFRPLGQFLSRLVSWRIKGEEVAAEYAAQHARFRELVGDAPANVNAHHHLHAFPTVRRALAKALANDAPRPFVRRVAEPWRTTRLIPGGRVKRRVLSWLGRRERSGVALAGVCDMRESGHPDFFTRWLRHTPGRFVELVCHPGHPDPELKGRDEGYGHGGIDPRAAELARLLDPVFRTAVTDAGFRLVTAREMMTRLGERGASAPW